MNTNITIMLLALSLRQILCYKPKLLDTIKARLDKVARREFAGENSEGCKEGWVKWGQMKCYRYGDKTLNWDDAQRECMAAGAHLAEVGSREENDFLLKLWTYSGTKDEAPWLGATDMAKEGEWRWAGGETMEFQFWAEIYGEPNGGEEENCLSFHHKSKIGRWNDSPCSMEHSYICEKYQNFSR